MKLLIALLVIFYSSSLHADTFQSGASQFNGSVFDLSKNKPSTFGTVKSYVGVEFETGSTDMDYRITNNFGGTTTTDSETTNFRHAGLYAAYRSKGSIYFKAKAGLQSEEINDTFFSKTEVSKTGGIGGGVNLGRVNIEAEYTVDESDANFASIGLNLHF